MPTEGLVPWNGKAGQVRIGHLLQGARKTAQDVWEVTEMRHPAQMRYGHTLWWRVANVFTGEMAAIPPKVVRNKVVFMLTPEEFEQAEATRRPPHKPHQWPVDSDEVLLLVEKLGATTIAERDNVTGEIICPSFDEVYGDHGAAELEHLRIAHGLDTSALELMTGQEKILAIAHAHGPLHSGDSLNIRHHGFPHRHVPEDTSFL